MLHLVSERKQFELKWKDGKMSDVELLKILCTLHRKLKDDSQDSKILTARLTKLSH